jgi:hypothetical protein
LQIFRAHFSSGSSGYNSIHSKIKSGSWQNEILCGWAQNFVRRVRRKTPSGTEREMAAVSNVLKRFLEYHALPAIQKRLSVFFSSGHYLMDALAG